MQKLKKLKEASFSSDHFNRASKSALESNKIVELLNKQPVEIVLQLCNPQFNLDSYLNATRIDDRLVYDLVTLIENALKCNSLRFKLNQILTKIAESTLFCLHVHNLITFKLNNEYNLNFIKSVLNICCQMIEVVPLVSIKIAHIKDCLENIIPNQLNDLLISYKKFAELYDIAAKRLDYEQKMKTFTNIDHSIVEPPNCITEMNIIPKLEDILTDQAPFLRRTITNGAEL